MASKASKLSVAATLQCQSLLDIIGRWAIDPGDDIRNLESYMVLESHLLTALKFAIIIQEIDAPSGDFERDLGGPGEGG